MQAPEIIESATRAQIREMEAAGRNFVLLRIADEHSPDLPDPPGGPYPARPEEIAANPTPQVSWGFNPAQLSTLAEAQQLKAEIGGLGGGVTEIYVPTWMPGPGAFPEPRIDEARFYHFRFANGAEGINVGLVRETKKRYPTRWLSEIARDMEIG